MEDEDLSREILALMAKLKASHDEMSSLLDDQNLRNTQMSADLRESDNRCSEASLEIGNLKKAIAEKETQLDEAEVNTSVSQ